MRTKCVFITFNLIYFLRKLMKNELKDIVICGAGGLGREIAALIKRDYAEEWHIIGFIDPNPNLSDNIDGLQLLPENYLDENAVAVVLGMASAERKAVLFKQLSLKHNINFPNIISRKAIIAPDTHLGNGNVITDFCWVSTNVTIGDGVLVNVATTIGHDSKIGDFVSIMPQCAISGKVNVENSSLIGAKSFILQGKHIGQRSVVAAGSCVFRNVDDGETVWGNPAHTLIKSNKHRG